MSKPFHVIATPDENGNTVNIFEIRMFPPAAWMLPILCRQRRQQKNRTNRTGMSMR